MHDFIYQRPSSLVEAHGLAVKHGAMLLAGGQSLLRDMKRGLRSASTLVDITGLIPNRIERRDNTILIGAGATHAEVASSVILREHLPVLAELVGHIGDPAVRHRGTLGGAIAANEIAGDYPAACLALDSTVHTTVREIAAKDFFIGNCKTALAPGEIVTAVSFRIRARSAYIKFLNPAARYAVVGVFAASANTGSTRIAITGAHRNGAFRWLQAEVALSTGFEAHRLSDVRLSPDGLVEDLFADSVYRGHLAYVLTCRAVGLATAHNQRVMVISHGSPFDVAKFET